MNGSAKNIIKHVTYKLNEQIVFSWIQRTRQTPGVLLIQEQEIPPLITGMKFAIFVDWYDIVTPFGQE